MKIQLKKLKRQIHGRLIYDSGKEIKHLTPVDEPLPEGALVFVRSYIPEDKLIKKLLKAGAMGVVIKREYEYRVKTFIENQLTVIMVKSCTSAFYEAIHYYRSLFQIPVVEVTGSAGKTTTKEMIGCVLKERFNTLVGEANYNAPTGVAYHIDLLTEEHEAMVLEAGMRDLGIIDLSSYMIQPTIGVITCIQSAHLMSLVSTENLVKAKQELLPHISKNGALVINGDCELTNQIDFTLYKGPVYRVGLNPNLDLYATDITYKNYTTKFIVHDQAGTKEDYQMNTFGEYNVRNALLAIQVGLLLGLTHAEIKQGLRKFKPIRRRLEIINLTQQIDLINDNFNANPESTKQLIDELPRIKGSKSLFFVIGDIEKGDEDIKDYAIKVHETIGKEIHSLDFSHVICVGKWARYIYLTLRSLGVPKSKLYYFSKVKDAQGLLPKIVQSNSLVVFKAQHAYIDFKPLINELMTLYQ